MANPDITSVPVQPVERPILCGPYDAPNLHWHYDRATGEASKLAGRRPARYWYKTKGDAAGQQVLEFSEGQEDLLAVNQLREDVARWRDLNYEGVTPVTRELLRSWSSAERSRRLFFCQREAVETVVYLAEVLRTGRRPRFTASFPASDLAKLIDQPANPALLPLTRFGCKMATGAGKTVVMAMLTAWAFCNRGRNPDDARFPNAVLVCCPNLTVKERLQVLRPDLGGNYYEAFDIVPVKLRPLMQNGKVLVTNWHAFAPESEHSEGGKSYAVVNKGAETPEAFARRILGDLYDRMPILVLNDEAHHCYRPAAIPPDDRLTGEEARQAQADREEATIWIEGLDRINNALASPASPSSNQKSLPGAGAGAGPGPGPGPGAGAGINLCVDLSATPFYISGCGYPEGSPFPWLVSDFGLVDAIESGIVKIPRLPVSDTTGRPEAKYFRLWRAINESIEPGERLPGKARKPKPDVVYREAEPALKQLAGQWVEKFKYIQEATPGQQRVPPVLILVCDNVDIAEVFYRKISGESEEEVATPEDVAEALGEDDDADDAPPPAAAKRNAKAKVRTIYSEGAVFPQYFSNTPMLKRTIRIDSKLFADAESEGPGKSRQDAAEALRKVVATVGKPGAPGEHVRCVVSVAMLTEGWDANNVTHILGIRAFGSQLLCEQVVGRGLRRMDYTPDPNTGLLTEEYVDVYGIPFTVVPFKGRPVNKPEPDDRPNQHVRAMPERAAMEIRFPVVEGYAFGLTRNLIRCDIAKMEPLVIEPGREPTATFLQPTVGYQEGTPSQAGPFQYVEQDRNAYYKNTHLQAIKFHIARLVVDQITVDPGGSAGAPGAKGTGGVSDAKRRALRLQSRHQLFPQVLRFVDEYVRRKVDFGEVNQHELGLAKYVERMVERLCDAIEPDESEGEPPLLPVLNRYKPWGTTAEVDFTTKRPCHGTQKSHINQVVLDTRTWEASATFRLESSDAVSFYARNDHLGLTIPYEYNGVDHAYEPDFLVRLRNGVTLVLEIKGFEDDQTKAKHGAAKRWVSAINNAQQKGTWAFHVCRDPQVLERELVYLASVLI